MIFTSPNYFIQKIIGFQQISVYAKFEFYINFWIESHWIFANMHNKDKNLHKRFDNIQGMRGIAILSVLFFHIWPKSFPSGYLGVDIFFVISGFLMAKILSNEKNLNCANLKIFYMRRIKRIIPIYLVVVGGIYILGRYLLFYTDLPELRRRAMFSLCFASNFKLFEERDYFMQQDEINFYLHTWSLAVEIQFYLIVPFIFLILHRISTIYRFTILCILVLISLYLQLNTGITWAFPTLQCRIWQFGIGILVYFTQNCIKKSSNVKIGQWKIRKLKIWTIIYRYREKILFLFTTLILISTIFAMAKIKHVYNEREVFLRIYITLLAGILIFIVNFYSNPLLSNAIIVYMGDISYSMYLIHWPVIKFINYYNDDHDFCLDCRDNQNGLFLIQYPFLISIIFYHFFEKPLMNSKVNHLNIVIGTCIIQFLLFNLVYFEPTLPFQEKINRNSWSEMIINSRYYVDGYFPILYPKYLTKERYDKFLAKYPSFLSVNGQSPRTCLNMSTSLLHRPDFQCEISGNGDLSVLVIGNSYANVHFDGIVYAVQERIKIARLYAIKACTIYLYCATGQFPKRTRCVNLIETTRDLIEKTRPDLVFFITKYYDYIKTPIQANDTCVNSLNEFFNFTSQYSKAIFYPDHQVEFDYFVTNELAKRIWMKKPLTNMNKLYTTHLKEMENGTRRFQQINCPKCFMFNWTGMFCQTGICQAYDEEFEVPLFRDQNHVNRIGVAKVFTNTQQTIRNALKSLKI